MKEETRPYFVKDSFVLYRSYLNHIELMSLENRGIWITAILCYVNDLPLPEMPPDVRMAFSFVKGRIDEDYRKYQETLEKKRKAGQKGGIASGISRRSEASASSASENEANEDDNDYEYDNDDYVNDTVNVSDNVSDPDPVPDPVPVPDPDPSVSVTVSDPVTGNPFRSRLYNIRQSYKEAKRGMERDIDLDALSIQEIIDRTPASDEEVEEALDYLGITKGR